MDVCDHDRSLFEQVEIETTDSFVSASRIALPSDHILERKKVTEKI